ncbi:MAG: hypothetical protein KME38_30445 [Spirirestis rafaelensis WJT71-NPBG6]|jgi:hypothetical protein|nr:hypothetical protein [Spirirestis rafaelensis WJT71-NPBG6]
MLKKFFFKWLAFLFFIFEILLLILLSLVSYEASLALLLGISLALPLMFFNKSFFILQIKKIKIKIKKIIFLLKKYIKKLVSAFLFFNLIILLLFIYNRSIIPRPVNRIVSIRVDNIDISFEPLNENLTEFQIIEKIGVEKNQFESFRGIESSTNLATPKALKEVYSDKKIIIFKSNRNIKSVKRGFLLNEISVIPLNPDLDGYITLYLKDGLHIKGPTGLGYSEKIIIIIEVENLPKGSFYEAKYVNNLEKYKYLGFEKVRWSVSSIEKEIRFAYILQPFNYLHWALQPLLKLSSIPLEIITLLGAIVTFIFVFKLKKIAI